MQSYNAKRPVKNSNCCVGESSLRTRAPGADIILLVRAQQLLCGETDLADSILCKGRDHVERKGQSINVLQKCVTAGS